MKSPKFIGTKTQTKSIEIGKLSHMTNTIEVD